MDPKKLFGELRRRNVYRAAVPYGVMAWFLTQLTTQVFPFFEIPNSAVRLVVIALAIGFPIAMLLSWIYEFTPEGVVRTEDLDPVQAKSPEHASDLNLTQLLQMPYPSAFNLEVPITRALLRLDPTWDPLHSHPAFQKLCEEKQP